MCPPAGQDLLLSRTVIGRRKVALRGPLRLRLASACQVDTLAACAAWRACPAGHSGINTRLTAPPELSQSSTPLCLLVPRHPPHALISLATLFPPSVDVSHLSMKSTLQERKCATLARRALNVGISNNQFSSSSKGSCYQDLGCFRNNPCQPESCQRPLKKHQVVLDATSYPTELSKIK